MSIHIDDEGHRHVKAEIEVPGTPEEVWEAIATGPGIASWFMPMETEFDAEVGGKVRTRMGDEMVEIATLTAWDPPRRFVSEGPEAYGPGSPPVAFEWQVEAKSGGTCIVRLVQSLFTTDDDWDTQMGDAAVGWPAFFQVLRAYLERHRGQPCTIVLAMAPTQGTVSEAYARLKGAMELTGAAVGEAVSNGAAGAPGFAGTVDDIVVVGEEKARRTMLRLEEPCPGTGWIGASSINGQAMLIVSLYYYGEGAAEAGARDTAGWGAWLQDHAAGGSA